MEVETETFDFAKILLAEYGKEFENHSHEDAHDHQAPIEPVIAENLTPKDPLQKYDNDYERWEKMYGIDMREAENKEPNPVEDSQEKVWGCMHDKRKERDIYDRPNSEKLETASYFKTEGNTAFKAKDYQKASYMYQKALLYMTYTIADNKPEEAQCDTLNLTCNLNMAAVKLQQKDYHDAISYCDITLRQEAGNKKALYRKAQGFIGLDQFEDARTIFDTVLGENKNQIDFVGLKKVLEEKEKLHLHADKKAYGKMFDGSSTLEK